MHVYNIWWLILSAMVTLHILERDSVVTFGNLFFLHLFRKKYMRHQFGYCYGGTYKPKLSSVNRC